MIEKSGIWVTRVALVEWVFCVVALVPVMVTVKEPTAAGALKVRVEVPEAPGTGLTEKEAPLAPGGKDTDRLTSSVNP